MSSYEMNSDIAEEKDSQFTTILGINALIHFATTIPLVQSPTREFAIIWFGSLANLIICAGLHRLGKRNLAAGIYILGWLLIPAVVLWDSGPNTAVYFLMLLPVALSGIVLDTEIDMVTGAGLVLLFAATLHSMPLVPTLSTVFVPASIMIVLAIIVYQLVQNKGGLLAWAIDSQQKNARRAEIYYEQREQLKQAMLDLKHANAQLELLNFQLDEAQTRAERASQAKTVFLSNMSHELRTPLNVIIGYTSSMLSMPQMYNGTALPDPFRPDIQLIQQNGQYLVELINDVLDLSKIEAGKLTLHCETVHLPDILSGTISTAIGLLKDKPVQIVPDYPKTLPSVWADPIRVRQIILNLMSNAIKFTDTGSVTLSARIEGERIRISITDTGIGIPESALKIIFDRFQQAQEDTDKRYGGTGLGLDISQQLCQMHGGELTVKSVVGQGSTFSFTLAMAAAVVAQTPIEMPALSDRVRDGAIFTESAKVATADTGIVMLVEDDANTRTMLRRMLENTGYIVIDSNKGGQVMELAGSLLPGVIILDIHLPDMDGWEVLKNLKADAETRAIPIIVCTYGNQQARALELGAATYLNKPFTNEALLVKVQEVLAPKAVAKMPVLTAELS